MVRGDSGSSMSKQASNVLSGGSAFKHRSNKDSKDYAEEYACSCAASLRSVLLLLTHDGTDVGSGVRTVYIWIPQWTARRCHP